MVSGTKQMLNQHSQDEELDENGAEAGLRCVASASALGCW